MADLEDLLARKVKELEKVEADRWRLRETVREELDTRDAKVREMVREEISSAFSNREAIRKVTREAEWAESVLGHRR